MLDGGAWTHHAVLAVGHVEVLQCLYLLSRQTSKDGSWRKPRVKHTAQREERRVSSKISAAGVGQLDGVFYT